MAPEQSNHSGSGPRDESDRSPREKLTSWKEIAARFHRDVRTVQRWEREEGLPVHRHLHHRRSSVYAYPEELEAWWRERGSALEEPAPQEQRKRALTLRWVAGAAVILLVSVVVWLARRPIAAPARLMSPQVITFDGTRSPGYLVTGLTGDLNGDGIADLVSSANEALEVYILMGGSLPPAGGRFPASADVVISLEGSGSLEARQVSDFNGDGLKDLLVTHGLGEPESLSGTGPNYLIWGRKQWPQRLQLPQDADVTILAGLKGYTIALAGCLMPRGRSDLNGDGIEDVMLGALENSPYDRHAAGSMFVLYGRKKWPPALDVLSHADVTIHGSQSGQGLGAFCALGDFNSDGHTDVAVAATEHTLWNLMGTRRSAYVFLGQSPWPAVLDARTDSYLHVVGLKSGNDLAAPLLADVNGDGADDLVLGWSHRSHDAEFRSEIQIWFGGQGRRGQFPADTADVRILADSTGLQLGAFLTTADLDTDGLQDIIASETSLGRIHLFYGRRQWPAKGEWGHYQPVTLFETRKGSGHTQMGAGDYDDDGLLELAFSDPTAGGGEIERSGRLWLLKPYVPVRVEIRPGSTPNFVYFPHGIAAVRVYGSPQSLADPFVPETARLAGAAPKEHVVRDENGDGIPDLLLYFPTTRMRAAPSDTRLVLTARTRSGLLVGGSDEVQFIVHPATSQATEPRNPANN